MTVKPRRVTGRDIVKAGGVSALISQLTLVRLLLSDEEKVRGYALWSLSRSISEENQSVVSEAGGIEPLVRLLSDPADSTREQAARAARYLATGNGEVQRALVLKGATKPMVALLNGDPNQPSLQHAVAAERNDYARFFRV